MSHRKAPLLGLVLQRARQPVAIDPFYSTILAAMEEAAARIGGGVMTVVAASLDEELEFYARWAVQGPVDGVVIVDLVDDDVRPGAASELGLPAVVLGDWPVPDGVDDVGVDNFGSMLVAVRHLVALGHRVIARVSGPADLIHTRARTDGFRVAIGEAGATGVTVEADYSVAAGRDATLSLLRGRPHPTAIIFDNDLMAVGALKAAVAVGVAVPNELSILAWDDSAPARLAVPPLSVLAHDTFALGEIVATTLLRRLAGESSDLRELPVSRVLERGTTAPTALP